VSFLCPQLILSIRRMLCMSTIHCCHLARLCGVPMPPIDTEYTKDALHEHHSLLSPSKTLWFSFTVVTLQDSVSFIHCCHLAGLCVFHSLLSPSRTLCLSFTVVTLQDSVFFPVVLALVFSGIFDLNLTY
jgi:hypothetical protein